MNVATIPISHPERVVYPDNGTTKEDLARYYEAIAPLMLPHVRLRPLTVVRCPEGLAKQCFFQKHWTPQQAKRIKTRDLDEGSGKKVPYALASRAPDLVALVQHGMMETHIWGSTFSSLERPDRMVFDLDPGPGVSWTTVKRAALDVRALLAELKLESWVKLTGGKGVHVVAPIERRVSWDTLASFAKAVAVRMERDNAKLYVAKASKALRDKRIFVDWLRNTRGATWVAPWSTRAREGSSVSVPVEWPELATIKRANAFNIDSVLELIEGRYADPWTSMLTAKQRLTPEMAEALLA